ncbi:MAG: pentapeptide repeat-containing protein [Limnothrix sp. RL_2_0]|nr:pentapeptide repeat-containing protein [Limnothrix sp. RL_2_0]
MKAKHIIERYEAGERNFQRLNLRGMNFKKVDLSGADFSECNICGTNFRGATLKKTNFIKTKGGLQKRWYFSLLLASIIASSLAGLFNLFVGLFAVYVFDPSSQTSHRDDPTGTFVMGIVGLTIYLILILLAWRQGIVAGTTTFAGAVAVLGGVAVIVTASLGGIPTRAVAKSIAGVGAGAVAVAVAVVIVGAGVGAGAVAVAGAEAIAGAGKVIAVVVVVVTGVVVKEGAVVVFWAWIGWRAWRGDPRDAWVRSFAVAYGPIGGTCFRGADLTGADFTGARLKSTDFREATLVRTIFKDTIKLDQVRPGKSYLAIKKIRELLLTKKVNPDEQYNDLVNLRGLNLAAANLVGANFSGSNLSNANLSGANLADANLITANLNDVDLKDADLTRAKLVQTQLDNADLTGATLTGACIEDWGITIYTILNGIYCDYVYMRFIDGDKRRRKPDGEDSNFAEGEFVEFIKPLVDTLDLYHRQVKDPRTVSLALKKLQTKHPEANIDPISWERRGKNGEDIMVRANINPKANPSQLHIAHFDEYDRLQSLPPTEIAALMAQVESQKETISMLKGFVDNSLSRPITQTQNVTQENTMTEKQGDTFNMQGSNIGVGVNKGAIESGAVVAGQYNAAQKQTLAEAATEIQALLRKLESQHGNQTTIEKMTVAQEVIREIKANPNLAQRIYRALKTGSVAALDSWLDRPEASFVIEALKDWYETAPEK